MQPIIGLLVCIFGVIIGSFLNVVILRLPKGESLNGRSHCPHCKAVLTSLDLFPVVSFIFLRGRCRHCHAKISPRYLLVEITTAILFYWAFYILQPAVSALGLLMLAEWFCIISVCIVTFVVDLENYVILSYVVALGAIFILVVNLVLDLIMRHNIFDPASMFMAGVIGGIVSVIPFLILWYASKFWQGRPGKWMGFGDVQLAACLGVMLGWPLAEVGIFIAIMLGGVIGVLLLVFKVKTLKSKIPFGTFLSIGSLLSLFYGPIVLKWYLSLIGIGR